MRGRGVLALARVVHLGSVVVLTGLLGALIAARGTPGQPLPFHVPLGPDTALSPVQLQTTAASALEAATAPGGTGYSFTVVQASTMKPSAGGSLVPVPDPSDATKVSSLVDSLQVASIVERGIVRPDGFWSEMRAGPLPGQQPDFENAQFALAALVKDKATWRDDGRGWYRTSDPPGIGVDPLTARLLPTLLRDLSAVSPAGNLTVDGVSAHAITGKASVADIPGVIAVDGAKFTELSAPLEVAFDAEGRLLQIHAVARNTNLTDFDLVVDTVISLDWSAPSSLPDPSPLMPDPSGLITEP